MQSYTVLTVLLAVLAAVPASYALTPEIVTDAFGNSADADSQVTWADIPDGKPYSPKYFFKPGSNFGLYNMASQFLSVVMPVPELPYDQIIGMVRGTMETTDAVKSLIGYVFGFAFCIVLGLVFIIVMPCVGCCFCGCRVANKCGGRRHQKNPKTTTFVCLFIALIVITNFLFAGVLMMLVANSALSETIGRMETVATNSFDDVLTFLDNSLMELEFVAINGSKFTRDVVFRDLDNIGDIVGNLVQNTSSVEGHVDTLIHEAQDYGNAVQSISTSMNAIRTAQTAVQTQSTSVETSLTAIKTRIGTIRGNTGCAANCQAIQADMLAIIAPFGQLPDITTSATSAENTHQQNFFASGSTALRHFEGIPNRVNEETATIRREVKSLVNGFLNRMERMLRGLMAMPNELKGRMANVTEKVVDVFAVVEVYDNYRATLGLVLALAIFLVLGLQVTGMLFGGLTYSANTTVSHPTRRSSASNTGGTLLLVAVACVFLYSSLLMFVVTTTFFVGGALQKFVCEPLMDPEYRAFGRLIDSPDGNVLGKDGYILSKFLLNNASIPLKVSGVLEACRNNEAAFSALQLNRRFDLDAITNLTQFDDINQHIDSLNVNLTDINFITTAQENILNDFAASVVIDFSAFKTVLQMATMAPTYQPTVEDIRQASTDTANSAGMNTALAEVATDLEALTADQIAALEGDQAALLQKVVDLETLTNGMPARTAAFINSVRQANDYVNNQGTDAVRQIITDFADRLFGVIRQFTSHLTDAVNTDLLRCRPVWDLWYNIIHDAVCTRIVRVLNGFWYGLAWCIVFMVVSLILNVRLAKYMRRMRTQDNPEEDFIPSSTPLPGEMDMPALYGPYDYGQPPYGDNTIQYPQQLPMASVTPGAQEMRGYTDISAASTGSPYIGDPGYQQTGQQPNYASYASTDDQYSRRAPAQATEDPSGYYAGDPSQQTDYYGTDPYQQTDYYGTDPYQQTDYYGTGQQQTGYEDGYQQPQGADADTEAKSDEQQPSSRHHRHHSRKHSTSGQHVEAEKPDQDMDH